MINKILLKFFMTVVAISLLLLTLAYLTFINTDRFLNYFKGQFDSLLLSNIDNYEISYLDISGSFSTDLTIKALEFKDSNSTILFNEITVVPKFTSNFYSFIQAILDINKVKFTFTEFEKIIIDEILLQNKSVSFYLEDITVNHNEIKSPKIKINASSHNIIAEGLSIVFPHKITINDFSLEKIINKNNNTSLSTAVFFNDSYDVRYEYKDIMINPSFFVIRDNFYNITINKCDYYYNDIKYYFISDFNFNSKNGNSDLKINSFRIFDRKEKNKIDILGTVDFNNMDIGLEVNTNKQNYFNLFKPTSASVEIKGSDYFYYINFKLSKVKNFVENTIDEIKGDFILNLSDSLDFLIRFDSPVKMKDKDYEGTFSISDIKDFDDIYNPSVIVGTDRINPFKLNQFKQLD